MEGLEARSKGQGPRPLQRVLLKFHEKRTNRRVGTTPPPESALEISRKKEQNNGLGLRPLQRVLQKFHEKKNKLTGRG